jgi:hypothetical protein
MSQKAVQLLIGQLLTDEEVRERFSRAPAETLRQLREHGVELTGAEIDALLGTDLRLWSSTAKRIDRRLQRCSLRSE